MGIFFSSKPSSEEEREIEEIRGHLQRVANFHPEREKFVFGKTLGEGGFGKVVRARDAQGRLYAVKQIETAEMDRLSLQDLEREFDLLTIASSHLSCIPQVYGKYLRGSVLYLFMEFIPGSTLFDLNARLPWTKRDHLPLRLRVQIFYQLSKCLCALHSLGLAHRDLKPMNVMLLLDQNTEEPTGQVKIVDFGFTCLVRKKKNSPIGRVNKVYHCPRWTDPSGTKDFRAPELLTDFTVDYLAVDIYALGRTAYYLFWGRWPPFFPLRPLPIKTPEEDRADDLIRELVSQMAEPQPKRRPTAEQVMNRMAEIVALWESVITPPIATPPPVMELDQ